ncbi:hypothetical protein [Massilia niastensis]|uniref:hypothetical protein n=1 Tax=Massilia niastensis TaxID=544911 RepID=UPI00036C9DF6|nr:hypothetical protein [Massilia niastensis]
MPSDPLLTRLLLSDSESWFAVGVVSVKTARAVGAEQVGHAHAMLSQDQFQVGLLAFRADFPHATEGQQVEGLHVAVDVVDNGMRIQFAENKVSSLIVPPAGLGLMTGRMRYSSKYT